MAGEYAMQNAGADLRAVDARLLFPIAYASLRQSSLRTKEEFEALDSLNKKLHQAQVEYDTGVPSFADTFKPADQIVNGAG